jgi:hypothetical protein
VTSDLAMNSFDQILSAVSRAQFGNNSRQGLPQLLPLEALEWKSVSAQLAGPSYSTCGQLLLWLPTALKQEHQAGCFQHWPDSCREFERDTIDQEVLLT